ncbi:MAG: M48 family metallopeptidase [Odoribacteraceae bacterium]|jgi:predicted metal-dependent hydrolase|nr:M48 family metallopeptidase [Odoribacteraceae bacterium]
MKREFILPDIGSVKARRGDHIKVLSIRMAAGRGIWVNIPGGVSDREAEAFLLSKRAWLIQHKEELKEYEEKTGVGLGINTEVKTKFHVLKVLATASERPSCQQKGNELVLFIPEKVAYERAAPFVENILIEIYRDECNFYLPKRVAKLARACGFTYRHLSFRNNLSNWGSCSMENNISLNVKLMKLPDALIDYVILHELCHTVEKNHSARFWALMQRVCPRYAELRAQLKTYNTRI